MTSRTIHIAGLSAFLFFAGGSIPVSAWEQQEGLRSLPSGGLMLKELPNVDPQLNNLPGVRLNPQMRAQDGGTKCSQKRVSGFGYGPDNSYVTGTASECSFGNFTITTVRPDPQPWNPGNPTLFGN